MKCGVNNVRRNIQFLILIGSIILSGCAIESKYENEDEKLLLTLKKFCLILHLLT